MACLPPFFFFCSCVCLLLCSLSFFALVVFCLSSCLVFVALWVWLLFPFPFRTTRKKKGRAVLVRPLFVCRECFIWLLLCIPRTRQVSARLYRNKVLEKGNLIECSKLFCARLCSYLCSSKFVFLLFSYLFLLVGSYFLSPFRLSSLYSASLSSVCQIYS